MTTSELRTAGRVVAGDNLMEGPGSCPQPADSRRIITTNVFPPIPLRAFDWCAYRDGDEENGSRYGWGATEEAAIADLMLIEEGEE